MPPDDAADGWDLTRAVACAPACGERPKWLSKLTRFEVRELGAETLSDAVRVPAFHEAAPRLHRYWRRSVTHRWIPRSRLEKTLVPASSSTWLPPKTLRRRFPVRPGSVHERAAPNPGGMGRSIVSSLGRSPGSGDAEDNGDADGLAAGDRRGSIRTSLTGRANPCGPGGVGGRSAPSRSCPPRATATWWTPLRFLLVAGALLEEFGIRGGIGRTHQRHRRLLRGGRLCRHRAGGCPRLGWRSGAGARARAREDRRGRRTQARDVTVAAEDLPPVWKVHTSRLLVLSSTAARRKIPPISSRPGRRPRRRPGRGRTRPRT